MTRWVGGWVEWVEWVGGWGRTDEDLWFFPAEFLDLSLLGSAANQRGDVDLSVLGELWGEVGGWVVELAI